MTRPLTLDVFPTRGSFHGQTYWIVWTAFVYCNEAWCSPGSFQFKLWYNITLTLLYIQIHIFVFNIATTRLRLFLPMAPRITFTKPCCSCISAIIYDHIVSLKGELKSVIYLYKNVRSNLMICMCSWMFFVSTFMLKASVPLTLSFEEPSSRHPISFTELYPIPFSKC